MNSEELEEWASSSAVIKRKRGTTAKTKNIHFL
jgi:hypothetical protein